jgi:hypothetical protein
MPIKNCVAERRCRAATAEKGLILSVQNLSLGRRISIRQSLSLHQDSKLQSRPYAGMRYYSKPRKHSLAGWFQGTLLVSRVAYISASSKVGYLPVCEIERLRSSRAKENIDECNRKDVDHVLMGYPRCLIKLEHLRCSKMNNSACRFHGPQCKSLVPNS